jgi:hypothetical protein
MCRSRARVPPANTNQIRRFHATPNRPRRRAEREKQLNAPQSHTYIDALLSSAPIGEHNMCISSRGDAIAN